MSGELKMDSVEMRLTVVYNERNENRSPPPMVKDSNLLRLDMITDGESPSKMSERCAASGVIIPKVCGLQMHKHTKFDQIK